MTREILFRGKQMNTNEWRYGYYDKKYWQDNKLHSAIKVVKDGSTYAVEEETIGQFTGLTDTNGKKIFEGDIVKHEDFIGKVVYFGDGFCIKDIPQQVDKSSWFILNHCVVIGNIYDNTKLLKQ